MSNAIDHVFSTLQLHRVTANYRPDNLRSARLLERLGFENEGLARAYPKIDGA
ncbi:RimJ/RimL family protein N-acetyltransferase [Paraburkholderia sp. 35.1]